jgi:hypothetical protein
VAYFIVLCMNFPGETEENHASDSGYWVEILTANFWNESLQPLHVGLLYCALLSLSMSFSCMRLASVNVHSRLRMFYIVANTETVLNVERRRERFQSVTLTLETSQVTRMMSRREGCTDSRISQTVRILTTPAFEDVFCAVFSKISWRGKLMYSTQICISVFTPTILL